MPVVLLWFRHDLRLHDNAALPGLAGARRARGSGVFARVVGG
jgi:deoxyribodipyrimidine photolyase